MSQGPGNAPGPDGPGTGNQGGGGGAFSGISRDQIERIAQNIEVEDVLRAVGVVKQMYLDAHLVQIRQRAIEEDPDPEDVREQLEAMTEEEKENIFYEALHALIRVLAEIRERPEEANYQELKDMIRDPFTTEALLLICEHETGITPEYSEQLKDFYAAHLRLIGVLLLPEMYSEPEIRRTLREFGYDPSNVEADIERR